MEIGSNHKIILASTSKIRRKILEEVKLNFTAISPDFDEEKAKTEFPQKSSKNLAIFLAKGKALSISKKLPNAYVIGSDQVCEFEEKEYSKSENLAQATAQLKKFNGKIHFQNNATVIAHNGKIIFQNFSRVKMEMRQMTSREIENYVEIDQPIGCAGSYKYESLGKHLFKKVSGDYYAVLGLAIQPLLSFLHQNKIISL
jgi:septum formation protein